MAPLAAPPSSLALVFTVVGAAVAIYGAFQLWHTYYDRPKRAWIATTPRCSGRVVAGEAGVLSTPYEKTECVWMHVVVKEAKQDYDLLPRTWREVYRDEDGRPFELHTEDGTVHHINPTGAHFETRPRRAARLSSNEYARLGTSRWRAFVRDLGLFFDRTRVTETTLRPGDELTVYAAPPELVPAAIRTTEYRDTPTTQSEFRPTTPMLLSTWPHKSLLRALSLAQLRATATMLLGSFLAAASLLLR